MSFYDPFMVAILQINVEEEETPTPVPVVEEVIGHKLRKLKPVYKQETSFFEVEQLHIITNAMMEVDVEYLEILINELNKIEILPFSLLVKQQFVNDVSTLTVLYTETLTSEIKILGIINTLLPEETKIDVDGLSLALNEPDKFKVRFVDVKHLHRQLQILKALDQ